LQEAGFDLGPIGFGQTALDRILAGGGDGAGIGQGTGDDNDSGADSITLAERFGVPPFSVLKSRKGWWQDRKRACAEAAHG